VRVATLVPGTGPSLDVHSLALLDGEGPAKGFLVPWTSLRADAKGTGSTPRDLAEALAAEQAAHGGGKRAVAGARALAEGALAVVAGQQPGLLGGPLYAAHKAAGAVAVAAALTERWKRPVVPVFWVASEDHDLDEANAAWLLDAKGSLRSMRLPLAGDGRSVRDVPLPASAVDGLLGELKSALPDTPRAAEAAAFATPPPAPDLGSWFATLLARLFSDRGLVVVEPHVLSPWAGPVLARLARGTPQVSRALADAASRLRAAGAAPARPLEADGPCLFLRDGPRGPRRRPAARGPSDLEDLARRVEREPHLASGDVVGRVFVQDALLPVAAVVGGPSELAYLSQVRAAHEALGVPFPAAAPRPSATWLDPRAEESVAAFGVPLADVLSGRVTSPPPSPGAEDEGAARLAGAARDLAAAAEQATSSKEAAALRAALRELEKAAAARSADADEREGRGRARWERALAILRPRGMPQERVLCAAALVARHGLEAVEAGLSSLDPAARAHQVVRPE
jgi:uncharacterized protein YllA (UPF0747 family)